MILCGSVPYQVERFQHLRQLWHDGKADNTTASNITKVGGGVLSNLSKAVSGGLKGLGNMLSGGKK